jgi:hypothetical protein
MHRAKKKKKKRTRTIIAKPVHCFCTGNLRFSFRVELLAGLISYGSILCCLRFSLPARGFEIVGVENTSNGIHSALLKRILEALEFETKSIAWKLNF